MRYCKTMAAIDNLIEKFSTTGVEERPKEISFVGKGLQLNKEEDAGEIVKAIQNCPDMTSLCLEGNTVGVPAAKVIGKALETQSKFQRAYWKDMFTGRDKTEIPLALDHLSKGMMVAGAKLTILDLSDNAFGPRGLVGIQTLLESPCCYNLEELYLNNNGLGITGGKMLSEAILNCINNSTKAGTPMKLRVFVCGRNRLENDGAKAVSKFLKTLGSLELVAMPQNGIYSPGIKALADAFSSNPGLKAINLEDNSLTEEGAFLITRCLPKLERLQHLNLGDCLVKTEGAEALARALKAGACPDLVELNLGFNEITQLAGASVVEAVRHKNKLEKLNLNGNQFGDVGCSFILEKMEEIGKVDVLAPLSEDEGDEDDNEEYEEIDGEEEGDYDEDSDCEITHTVEGKSQTHKSPMSKLTFSDFVSTPTPQALISLSEDNADCATVLPSDPSVSDYLELFFKISRVVSLEDEPCKKAACKFADHILTKTFELCSQDISLFNNEMLVSTGLIKSEDKSRTKKGVDITGTLLVLSHAVAQPYFHSKTREILLFFLSKPLQYVVASPKGVHLLTQALFKV